MKAAILHEFKQPLAIEEVARPKPNAHEVLIAVQACGVCHSDLHVAEGDWPQIIPITKKPLILGHEITGRVVEKGASVNHLELGDHVGVPWVHWTCGECEFCREGNENLCVKQQITGVTVDGGKENVVKELRRAGGVHAALVTSAVRAAYDAAFPSVRPGGFLLVVGLPSESLCFPPILMAASEIHIKASSVGTRQDMRELLAMAAAGTVRCQVATRPLTQVNEVFEQLRHGQVHGRMVLVPR